MPVINKIDLPSAEPERVIEEIEDVIGIEAVSYTHLGVIAVAVVMWLLPEIPISLSGALIVVVFGFFFASVSSRMVGLVGSSNNPVSGMAIATLIATTIIFKAMGVTGVEGMVAAISVGTVTVSYTHLDVYKRQGLWSAGGCICTW